jgi:general secretion pathway protein K
MSLYIRCGGLRADGFALAAVLWLLAGLTILAAMISQSNQILAQRQAQLKLRADAEQDFLSSRSEALYWLSSSRATQDGFGWSGQLLRVDGRGYAASGKSTLHVQDLRGLLSLNKPKREMWTRFLAYCGATTSQTDALLDALEDYVEKGELKRLNGAKSLEYSMAGLEKPRGAPLLAEPEIWKVFGWKNIQHSWDEKHCSEDVTVAGDSRFNPGTATSATLFAYGMNAEQIDLVMKERQLGGSAAIELMQNQMQSTRFMGLAEGRFPSRSFRVTHTMPEMPWMFRYELALKTNVVGVPWEISSPRRLPIGSVIMPAGRANWPKIDQISETDKNAITQPILPF